LLRLLASTARNKRFVFHVQEGGPVEPARDQLRICTFNTALMPDFIARWNGLRPPLDRSKEIAKAIKDVDDSIVCLQECFHLRASRDICNLLQDKYPYIIYNVGFQSMGLQSGSTLLSKYPLTDPRYIRHPVRTGEDGHATKVYTYVPSVPTINRVCQVNQR
jgi:hypothetical protein